MVNLGNFVEVKSAEAEAGDSEEFRSNLLADATVLVSLAKKYGWEGDHMKKLSDCWRDRRFCELKSTGFIPDQLLPPTIFKNGEVFLRPEPDNLVLASGTPKITLECIRQLSDASAMPVFPLSYLQDEAKPDDCECHRALETMVRELGWCDHYVIAPVSYYDLNKVAMDNSDRDSYAPAQIEQAWTALELAMPMFRMVLATDLRVGALEKELGLVKNQLNSLETRVVRLQERVDRQIEEMAKERARQEAENSKLAQELARLSRESFQWRDPLHVAIPRGNRLLDAGWAFVGPCWGPDLPEIVASAIGLKDTGGRQAIEMSVRRWAQWDR